ncbi:MAG: hypothetical protein ACXADF_18425, partial [Candidatus Thorarchaeota archaeon]
KSLAAEVLEQPQEGDSDGEPEEVDELLIAGRDWSVLAKMGAGIATLFFIMSHRDDYPNRYALIRDWTAKMRASSWLTEDEIRECWKVALSL